MRLSAYTQHRAIWTVCDPCFFLPMDVGVARRWGQLSASIGHDGADLLIAATALEHGLTVVTRNLNHFQPTGVATLNPWH